MEKYILKLYLAGLSPKAQQGIVNLKKAIKSQKNISYKLEVIDDYRRTLLSIPGVGMKTVMGLKSTDFFNAIDELIARKNALSKKIQRYLANDNIY